MLLSCHQHLVWREWRAKRWGDKWSLKTAKSNRFIISLPEYNAKEDRASGEAIRTQFKCRPRSWFICRKVGPLSASSGMSAKERVRDDWSLLCSLNFSQFPLELRVSLFNVPDFTSERLLHLHSMPEREIQTSKSQRHQSCLNNKSLVFALSRSLRFDPLSLVIRSFQGLSELFTKIAVWERGEMDALRSQDSIRSRQSNLSICVVTFCLFVPIWRLTSRQTCPNFGAFLASLAGITNNRDKPKVLPRLLNDGSVDKWWGILITDSESRCSTV